MALLFLDSSDHYASADLAMKYTSGDGTVTASGRHGNGLTGYNLGLGLANVTDSRCILGEAYYPFFFGGDDIFQVGATNSIFLTLDALANGCLQLSMAAGSNAGGEAVALSDPDVVRFGQWHYVELDVTFETVAQVGDDQIRIASGAVYVDGVAVISVTNFGAYGSPSILADHWNYIVRGGLVGGHRGDDFYVCDGSGAAPWNARLGDIEINVVRPNGAGATTEWTPSAGSNYQNVDDTTQDGNSTYNATSTVNHVDLFAMEDINTSDGIIGAQLLICAKRTEEGFAAITPLLRQGSTTYEGDPYALTTSYQYRNRQIYQTAPDGSSWTDTIFNAIQAGYKRST